MIDWTNIGNDQGRFTIHEDGQVTWQVDKTNPLPGDYVARIEKGATILEPKIVMDATCDKASHDVAQDKIQKWLHAHIADVLAPLFRLMDQVDNKLEGAAKSIGDAVYDNLGVIHRSEIEKFVPELTPELRATLRQKKVKMGPILVFMYELVKPAAINLRAMLWGVWNGRSLPMDRPADGRVSIMVDAKEVDRHYFRSIGYPVFGNLAIRIDMLDRVVTDIYDSSKEYKFQAQHKYMEWLGCGEEDLYAVLQSMGFRKVKDENTAKTDGEKDVERAGEGDNADAAEKKPELAVFLLKKGKISDRPAPKKQDKPKKHVKKKKASDNRAKSYSATAKMDEKNDDDSPFAILKQLQK